MAKKAYTFVLNFGYAESARMSFMPWTSSEKYATARDALVDLGTYLKEKYEERHEVKPCSCCTASLSKDEEAIYCGKCGRSLKVDDEFDVEGFMEFVSEMNGCDVDTFHGEYIDYSEDARWQPGFLEGTSNQRFVYQAEKVLAAAIGHTPDEQSTLEVICATRTKSKDEIFTFW